MTMRIYKWPLKLGHQTLQVPIGTRFLSAQSQDGQMAVWGVCDPSQPKETRELSVFGTGLNLPGHIGDFIGTVQQKLREPRHDHRPNRAIQRRYVRLCACCYLWRMVGMKPETLTALQGSIEKWQAIVDGTGEDNGSLNCPLCVRFLGEIGDCQIYADDESLDEACPVAIRANDTGCSGTPYMTWNGLAPDFGRAPRIADTPERKAAALAELNFLKSLLPENA